MGQAEFVEALYTLREHAKNSRCIMREVPSPAGLARRSAALELELGSAKAQFVVLHNDEVDRHWLGNFRLVIFASAPLEGELVVDPLLADVTYTWVKESLDLAETRYKLLSGTVTTTQSHTFDEISLLDQRSELEIRASWTPLDPNLGAHLRALEYLLEFINTGDQLREVKCVFTAK
ncbi:MAG: DUF3000 family protein [Actinomycetaceae bacterium]|nr:DUF3000 family protein [Actinomycetaceae bacterium]